MTVQQLAASLSLQTVTCGQPERQVTGCYIGDLLSWVMGQAPADCAWVTVIQNVNVAAVAMLADVACVILAEESEPDDALRNRAEEKGIALLSSPLDAYSLALQIHNVL